MPTVINLKDLTQSDGPGAIVDKVNFNFQALLSLGVGAQGPLGPQGPQGPAGPQGLNGPQGERGTRWYTYADIDPSDPALSPTDPAWVPPTDLEIGDIYTDAYFNVWEYQLNPVTSMPQWIKFIDSNTLFSTFLISTGITFKRTFQPSSGNPAEERFITFNQTAGADMSAAGSGTASYYNDTLFLHNFDQTQLGSEFTGQNVLQFYNSLQSIYADHYNSSDDLTVRQHFQLGSVYKGPGGARLVTKSNTTLKVKYKIVTDALSSPIMYLSLFNASKNDSDPVSLGQFNSAFQFKVSKWDGTNHTTMWAAITPSQNIQQFTDTTFPLIDGIVFARSISKVAFGIENNGRRLALVGSTGSGAIEGVYSNAPLDQFGPLPGVTQIKTNLVQFTNTLPSQIKSNLDFSILTPNAYKQTLLASNIRLTSDWQNNALTPGSTTIQLIDGGRVSAGNSKILAVAGEVMPTSADSPTANLMVNGSLAVGLRVILSTSGIGAMDLRQTDMTVYVNSIPAGATAFNLSVSNSFTHNRMVIIANNTSAALPIATGSSVIGTLAAKNTAVYQSFGSTWMLIFAAPNTLPTTGGTGDIYVSMAITNIRNTPIQTSNSNGTRQTADLAFSFWSDSKGTIALPIGNMEIRVQHGSTILDTYVSPTPVPQPEQPMFATTSTGGSPQILFPGVETLYTYTYRRSALSFTRYQYTRSNIYILADMNTSGANTQQDGTTLLEYKKVV